MHISRITNAGIIVGNRSGVDRQVRQVFKNARIFQASDFGEGRQSFARRSIAMVRSLETKGGMLLSFPTKKPPEGLQPSSNGSKCFGGFGSGTWATTALAVGLGLEVACFYQSSSNIWNGQKIGDWLYWEKKKDQYKQLSLLQVTNHSEDGWLRTP